MNLLQKKSLIYSLILGLTYYILSIYPNLFLVLFITNLLLITIISFYTFQIKLKRGELLEKGKFLILPILLNFGAIIFINGLFQTALKIFFTLLVTVANFYLFVALKKVQNLEERAAVTQRNIVISVSFFSIFLSLSAIFKSYVLLSTTKYQTLASIGLILFVGLVFYLVSYFLAWENGIESRKLIIYNLIGTLLAMEATLFGSLWIINYPVFSLEEKANLGGFPIPAITLTIIFYFIWGVMSHKIDRSLTRRILMEYIFITIIFLVVLFTTAKWLPIT